MDKKNYTIRVRDLVLGDGIPKICVPLTGRNRQELAEQIEQVRECPHDLVEWRADYYEGERQEILQELSRIREALGKDTPIIFTFRTKEEGGEREITPEEYRKLNLAAGAEGKADLIDLEYNRGEKMIREMIQGVKEKGTMALCSYHNFKSTPQAEKMVKIMEKMQQLGADVVKLAVMPESSRDVLALMEASLEMSENKGKCPFITMSMAKAGVITRLAGALTGSAVTFAAAAQASAPGQVSAWKMPEILELMQ